VCLRHGLIIGLRTRSIRDTNNTSCNSNRSSNIPQVYLTKDLLKFSKGGLTMRWEFSRLLAPSAILIAISCVPSEAQQRERTVEVCTGENANGCPGAHSAWYPCGVSPEQAASMVCTTYIAGRATPSPFRLAFRYIVAGGQCGYAGIIVTCLDQ
jgi:hypothetical protein